MPVALPDHLPGPDDVPRVLGRSEALATGFTRHGIAHRVATRRWHVVLPRTYLTGNTLTWADRLDAALTFAGPEALLTSGAALADLGLRSVPRPDQVLLLVPRSCRVRPTGWVRIRRTDRMPEPAGVPGPRRAATTRRQSRLATAGYTTMSRRPALVRREPDQFVRDVDAWLRARARELAA